MVLNKLNMKIRRFGMITNEATLHKKPNEEEMTTIGRCTSFLKEFVLSYNN